MAVSPNKLFIVPNTVLTEVKARTPINRVKFPATLSQFVVGIARIIKYLT